MKIWTYNWLLRGQIQPEGPVISTCGSGEQIDSSPFSLQADAAGGISSPKHLVDICFSLEKNVPSLICLLNLQCISAGRRRPLQPETTVNKTQQDHPGNEEAKKIQLYFVSEFNSPSQIRMSTISKNSISRAQFQIYCHLNGS